MEKRPVNQLQCLFGSGMIGIPECVFNPDDILRPPPLSSPLLFLSFHLLSLSNGLPFIVNVGSLCERPRSVELSDQGCWCFPPKPAWVGRSGPNNSPPDLTLISRGDAEGRRAKVILL